MLNYSVAELRYNKSVSLYVGKAIKKSRNIYEIFGKMMIFST